MNAKILTEALSTHPQLTKEHIKSAVDHILSMKISDDVIRRIALALNYKFRTANYAFTFNSYVDRAITKPDLSRLKVLASIDFQGIFQEFIQPKNNITAEEKSKILKIAEDEYKEIIKHNGEFPLCLGDGAPCDGVKCIKDFSFIPRIPLIEFCDIHQGQRVHRIYVSSFRALILGLVLNINPITSHPFNKEIRENLMRRYSLYVKMAL